MSHVKAILTLMVVHGLAFRSATTFLQYISMYIGVHLVWWDMHGLCILWNSFDLKCESVT